MSYLNSLMNEFGQTGDLFKYIIESISANTHYIFSLSSTEKLWCSFKDMHKDKAEKIWEME